MMRTWWKKYEMFSGKKSLRFMLRSVEEIMKERKKKTFSRGEEARLIYLLMLGGGVISFRPQLLG